MFSKFVKMLRFQEHKVRKCCYRWSEQTKQLLIDNKVNEQKQQMEQKYYLNG
ncbi:hypothetical protein [Halalkalibacter okhensis]|uniref:hypothetical protein n=1 Tax=Halalkalibacter okhensis TaxID=333138 RepID=UPI000A7AF474|nr:hypothetical protein [Halalkalibacter okhensis]